MPPLSCSSSRSSSDFMRKSLSSWSWRRFSGSSSAITLLPLHEPLVGFGGMEVRLVAVAPQREHDAGGTQRQHDDGQDPHEEAHPRVLRTEQDRLAVGVDVGLADLRVALAG